MIDLETVICESGCMCVKFYFRFFEFNWYILYKDIETYPWGIFQLGKNKNIYYAAWG